MGFTLYYRSTRPVSPEEAAAIQRAAHAANKGRTWLSCEPVIFSDLADGRLWGGSKPNFRPHPDDVASAAREGLPDGDVRALVAALCRISRDHAVDWELRCDHHPGPIGYIRGGVGDADLLVQVEVLSDLCEFLGGLSEEEFA